VQRKARPPKHRKSFGAWAHPTWTLRHGLDRCRAEVKTSAAACITACRQQAGAKACSPVSSAKASGRQQYIAGCLRHQAVPGCLQHSGPNRLTLHRPHRHREEHGGASGTDAPMSHAAGTKLPGSGRSVQQDNLSPVLAHIAIVAGHGGDHAIHRGGDASASSWPPCNINPAPHVISCPGTTRTLLGIGAGTRPAAVFTTLATPGR